MAPAPHYLRFARAVALVSVTATSPGCYASHVRIGDAPDAASPDAALADAGPPDAGGDPCATCACDYTGHDPASCEAQGHWQCCATLGPLPPPDLVS